MSAKTWGNCTGGLNCWQDRPPAKNGKRRLFKRGFRRLVRRQNRTDTTQRVREAA